MTLFMLFEGQQRLFGLSCLETCVAFLDAKEAICQDPRRS